MGPIERLKRAVLAFLVFPLLFISVIDVPNADAWIYGKEEAQPPLLFLDTGEGRKAEVEVYIDRKLHAKTNTSLLMELKAGKVYHFEVKSGKKQLFESSLSLSNGREVLLRCTGGKECLLDL